MAFCHDEAKVSEARIRREQQAKAKGKAKGGPPPKAKNAVVAALVSGASLVIGSGDGCMAPILPLHLQEETLLVTTTTNGFDNLPGFLLNKGPTFSKTFEIF